MGIGMQVILSGLIFFSFFIPSVYPSWMKCSFLESKEQQVVLFYDLHENYKGFDNNFVVSQNRHDGFDACASLFKEKTANYSVVIEDLDCFCEYFQKYFPNRKISEDAFTQQLRALVLTDVIENFVWAIGCLNLDRRSVAPTVDFIGVTSPIALFVMAMHEYPHLTLDLYLQELLVLKNRYEQLVLRHNDGSSAQDLAELNQYIDGVRNFINQNPGVKSSRSIYELLGQRNESFFREKMNYVKELLFRQNNDGAQKETQNRLKEMLFQNQQEEHFMPIPPFLAKDRDIQALNLICSGEKKSPWLVFMGAQHAQNIRNYLVAHCGFKETFVEQGRVKTTKKEYSFDQAMGSMEEIMQDYEDTQIPIQLLPCSANIIKQIKQSSHVAAAA